MIRIMEDPILLRSGLGLGNSWVFVQAHVSRFARLFNSLVAACRVGVLCTYTHFHMCPKQRQPQQQQQQQHKPFSASVSGAE